MRYICGLVFFLFLFFVFGAYGQTFRGAINGKVTDPSGAVVVGAMVTVTDTGTNTSHTMSSTSDGQFSFQDLPLGTYALTVTASGFEKTTNRMSR